MVVPGGLEPSTQGSSGLCSTNWATEPTIYIIAYFCQKKQEMLRRRSLPIRFAFTVANAFGARNGTCSEAATKVASHTICVHCCKCIWCPKWDLNPYGFLHSILSRTRIPIPPFGHYPHYNIGQSQRWPFWQNWLQYDVDKWAAN